MSAQGLRALQESFARAVLGGEGDDLVPRLDPGGDLARRRIALYRRAVTANLVGALRAAHPVVVRLVGEAFFHEAASRFAHASPPSCGDLNRFGESFADYLESYAPASPMPWLPDVARLEWACHEASMAGTGEPLDLLALANVTPEAHGDLRFTLHPSVHLVRSTWPILAIWEANQPDRDGSPERDVGEDCVLAWREAGEVRLMTLDPPQAAFVETLAAGGSLEAAAGDGNWDLPGFLSRLARHGVLGPFRVEIPGGPSPISA